MVSSPFLFPALSITKTAVWTIFALILFVWIIATLILEYHWKNYAMNEQKVASVRFLYLMVSFFLLAVIFLTVLSYP